LAPARTARSHRRSWLNLSGSIASHRDRRKWECVCLLHAAVCHPDPQQAFLELHDCSRRSAPTIPISTPASWREHDCRPWRRPTQAPPSGSEGI
jgi:hypothetical protein